MRSWEQVLRKYPRGTQGCRDLCFGGFNTYRGSAMRGVAMNVLALTPVGMKLCTLHHNCAILLYIGDGPMLQYTLYYFLGTHS